MLSRKMSLFAIGLVGIAALAFALFNNSAVCCATDPANTVQDISPTTYQEQFVTTGTSHLLIDVRTSEEFASGHIPGAVNIPVESLANRLNEVSGEQPIVVYCRSGNRSAQASQILIQAGYTTVYDLGGLINWTAQGFPIQ